MIGLSPALLQASAHPPHPSKIRLHAVCANCSARGSSNVFEPSEMLYLLSLGQRSAPALNFSDTPNSCLEGIVLWCVAESAAGGTMSSPARQVEPFPPEIEGDFEDEVRARLARLLADKNFPATAKRRAMLRFVVEETLAGRARELKGFTIATAVYGRDDSFDPKTDPVVRLEARRLRNDLNSYYVGAGADDPVRISIPKGGYVPEFERRAAAPLEELEPEQVVPGGRSKRLSRRRSLSRNDRLGLDGPWLRQA